MNDNYSTNAKIAVFAARIGAVVILLIMAGLVLVQQDNNRKLSGRIQSVQRQIKDVQNDNKLLQIELESYISLGKLEATAANYDMVYPDEVIYLKSEK